MPKQARLTECEIWNNDGYKGIRVEIMVWMLANKYDGGWYCLNCGARNIPYGTYSNTWTVLRICGDEFRRHVREVH